jgi:serine protease Do
MNAWQWAARRAGSGGSGQRLAALAAPWVAALLVGGAWQGPAQAGISAPVDPGGLSARPHATPARDEQALALQRASASVVGVEIKALEDASSNEVLGDLRNGSGVVIGDDGLVLTIGYLLLEAEEVDLRLDSGKLVPARVVAMDLASGFGMLQSLIPLDVPAARLASSTEVSPQEPLLLVTGGEEGAISTAQLSARQAYSGYWEYHIEHALFTRPLRTDHGGAGLFNARGELLGIGSLLVMETPQEYERGPGNLFVPVDLLTPIVDELRRKGSSSASRRAWLGLNCAQRAEGVQVLGVNTDSPADAAGLQAGDVVRRIDGTPVDQLASFYKLLWQGGEPERDISLEVLRDGRVISVRVHSMDRLQSLRRASGI